MIFGVRDQMGFKVLAQTLLSATRSRFCSYVNAYFVCRLAGSMGFALRDKTFLDQSRCKCFSCRSCWLTRLRMNIDKNTCNTGKQKQPMLGLYIFLSVDLEMLALPHQPRCGL
jgi:hypothetical protein